MDVQIHEATDDYWPLTRFVQDHAPELNIPPEHALIRAQEFRESVWNPDDLVLIAEQGSFVVGFLILKRGVKFSDRHQATLRIYLEKPVTHHHVGSEMLDCALGWARQTELARIVATPYLHDHGEEKLSFFKHHGFELEGVARKGARLLDGSFADVAQMAWVRF